MATTVNPGYIWAENGQATVTAGGTDAPASGTVETWTLSSSTLPAVTTGQTICPCADTLVVNSTETVWITNITGSTATVTRGAEGTTPVAHTLPFTIQNVNTVGALAQRLDWINVTTYPYNADPTGNIDATTAIQDAIAAVPAAGGVVYFPAGQYKISSPLTVDANNVTLRGDGFGFYSQILCNFTSSPSSPTQGMVCCGITATRQYVNIEGLCIQGNKNAFSGHGIVYRVEIGLIKDVIVQFTAGDGIHMSPNDLSSTTDTNTMENVYVQFPGGHGVSASSVADSEWTTVHVDGAALRTAPAYSSSTLYTSGNSVSSAGTLYSCTASTTGNAPPNASFWSPQSSLYGGITLYSNSGTYSVNQQVFDGSLGYVYTCAVPTTSGTAPTGTQASNTQWTYVSGLDGFHLTSGLLKLYGCHPFTNVNYGLQQVGAKGLQIHGGEYESNGLANIYLNNTSKVTIQGPALYNDPNPVICPANILVGSASTYVSISQAECHQSTDTGRSVPIGVQINGSSGSVSVTSSLFTDIGMTTGIQVDPGQNAANSTFTGNIFGLASSGTAIFLGGSTNCAVTGNRITSSSLIVEGTGADYNTFNANDVTAASGTAIVTVGSHSRASFNPGYNPVGHITSPPAVAGSGVAVLNNTGVDAMIIVKVSASGGATGIVVNGTTTGIASSTASTTLAPVRVPAAQTVAVTYANAPTWIWWGD